jgi:hypothetical protein
MNKNLFFMTLSVLDKKPITDIQARNNYKEVIWEYINDLSTLETIYVDVSNPAYKHKTYLDKLLVLTDRWKSLGDDAIPDDKVEQFLTNLQDNMREYLNKNLQSDFYQLRKTHYTKLAWGPKDLEIAPSTRLNDLRERAFSNLKPRVSGMG